MTTPGPPPSWTPGWLSGARISFQAKDRIQGLLEAVQLWQQAHHLPTDGLIGPQTWAQRDAKLEDLARDFFAELHRHGIDAPSTYLFLRDALQLDVEGSAA